MYQKRLKISKHFEKEKAKTRIKTTKCILIEHY